MAQAMWTAEGGGKDFEQAPIGNHIARCYLVVDLGTQKGEYQGKPTSARKVSIRFELCNELMTEGEMAGKPFSVGKIYTASLGEKANLRKDLESWRGRSFTEAELQGFSGKNILGKPCMINVGRTEKGKGKIMSVAAMPKGMEAPAMVNKAVWFHLDEFDAQVFEALSKWTKGEIIKSPEYVAMFKGAPPEHESDGDEGLMRPADVFEDDISF